MLLSTAEAAEQLRCSERTIRRLCDEGKLTAVKVGGAWLVQIGVERGRGRKS